ncbi:MAG: YtxH domain-containing protein [Actinobacteria bacterium]|nr:YtxH domain-containing protein [Actinomycetota bacterium]
MKTDDDHNGKNGGGSIIAALFAGLLIGAIAGILLAPKSGKETRKEIKEKSEFFIEKSKESMNAILDKTRDLTQAGKQKIEEFKMMSSEALAKGRKGIEKTAKKIKVVMEESKNIAKETEDYLS